MFAKLEGLEKKYMELEEALAQPDVFNDQEHYRKLTKAHADLREIVDLFRRHRALQQEMAENKQLLHDEDPDIRDMAHEEIRRAESELPRIEQALKVALLPTDPLDEKNTILEIRAGTGGEEAALFAADLFRMYTRYADLKGWKVRILDLTPGDGIGLNRASFQVEGHNAYGMLRSETGVHRLVRISPTDEKKRRHTTFAAVEVVPVLPDDDITVEIDPNDVRVDVYRSSGPGGQSVNTTDSAVRLTHIPTGIVVTCQNEKSQLQNKEAAFRVLRGKLYELEQQKREEELSKLKGEKMDNSFGSQIRNYVLYPYRLIKDTRSNIESGNVDAALDGDIDEFVIGYHRWKASL